MECAASLIGGAAAAHLALCLVVLGAGKADWIQLSREGFLLFVNINMLAAAAAATGAAAAGLKRLGERHLERRFSRALVAAATLLFGAEVMAMAEEFAGAAPALEVLSPAFLFGSRAGLALLLVLAITAPIPGEHRGRQREVTVALVAAAAVGGWGIYAVISPLFSNPGGLAPAVAAIADLGLLLVALAAISWNFGLGGWRRVLSLAGVGLYLMTDLYYYQHEAAGDPGFQMAELGYYSGYWLMAMGAIPDRSRSR